MFTAAVPPPQEERGGTANNVAAPTSLRSAPQQPPSTTRTTDSRMRIPIDQHHVNDDGDEDEEEESGADEQKQQQQQQQDEQVLLPTHEICSVIQNEMEIMGQALRCPLCLSALIDPVIISTCVHAYCRECLMKAFCEQKRTFTASGSTSRRRTGRGGGGTDGGGQYCCPTCRQSCSRRGYMDATNLNELVREYKLALVNTGLAPLQYEPTIVHMTQIAPSLSSCSNEEDKDEETNNHENDDYGQLEDDDAEDKYDDEEDMSDDEEDDVLDHESSNPTTTTTAMKEARHALEMSRTFARSFQQLLEEKQRPAAADDDDGIGGSTSHHENRRHSSTNGNMSLWYQQQQKVVEVNERTYQEQKKKQKQKQKKRKQQQQRMARLDEDEEICSNNNKQQRSKNIVRGTKEPSHDDDNDDEEPSMSQLVAEAVTQEAANQEMLLLQEEEEEQEQEALLTKTTTNGIRMYNEDNSSNHHQRKLRGNDVKKIATVGVLPEEDDLKPAAKDVMHQATTKHDEFDFDDDSDLESTGLTKTGIRVPPPQAKATAAAAAAATTTSSSNGLLKGRKPKLSTASTNKGESNGSDSEEEDMNRSAHDVTENRKTITTQRMMRKDKANDRPAQDETSIEGVENNEIGSEDSGLKCILRVGSVVHVKARTWPGVNKQGGVGRITTVHEMEDGSFAYDIAYVLGGKEKKVDAVFISTRSNNLGTYAPVVEEDESMARKSFRLKKMEETIPAQLLEQLKAEGFDVGASQDSSDKRKRRRSLSPIDTDHADKENLKPAPKSAPAAAGGPNRSRKTRKINNQVGKNAPSKVQDKTKLGTKKLVAAPVSTSPHGDSAKPSPDSAPTTAPVHVNRKSKAEVTRTATTNPRNKKRKLAESSSSSAPSSRPSIELPSVAQDIPSPAASLLSSSIPTFDDEEKCKNADALYSSVLQKVFDGNRPVINVVSSKLSNTEMALLLRIQKESDKGEVKLKVSKSFMPKATDVCVVAADGQRSHGKDLVAGERTMKLMRAALTGVPIVSMKWIQDCRDAKKVLRPTQDTFIRSLPTKVSKAPSSFGVAYIAASIQHFQTRMHDEDDNITSFNSSSSYSVLANHSIYICGFSNEMQADVRKLIREAGAKSLSTPSSVIAKVKSANKSNSASTTMAASITTNQSKVVLLCDVRCITNNGSSAITDSMCDEILRCCCSGNDTTSSTNDDRSRSSNTVIVVNPQWLFDSISCGVSLGSCEYPPSEKLTIATKLWTKIGKKHS